MGKDERERVAWDLGRRERPKRGQWPAGAPFLSLVLQFLSGSHPRDSPSNLKTIAYFLPDNFT